MPSATGGHGEDPEVRSDYILDYAKDGVIDSVGGRCGTSPSHVDAVIKKCEGTTPRKPMKKPTYPVVHMGGYVEDLEMLFNYVRGCAEYGLINPVGGCCGTLPLHINTVMKNLEGVAPGKLVEEPKCPAVRPPGLQLAFGGPGRGFQLIGARGHLTGAFKSKELVKACKLDEAVDMLKVLVKYRRWGTATPLGKQLMVHVRWLNHYAV